jgi:hypothetical protein
MHSQRFGAQGSGTQGPVSGEKVTLKLVGHKDGWDPTTERILYIYEGDITHFTGDAIVNAGTTYRI